MMFRMLSLNEKYCLTEEVISALDATSGGIPELQPLVDRVKANFDAVKQASLGLSHPELSQATRAGDALRDLGLKVLKYNASRSLKRRDAKWVAAGTLILQAFHDFGDSMDRKSEAKETASVTNFLAEVDRNAELRQAISTIGCDAWLQDIRDGQQEVIDSRAARASIKIAKPKVAAYKQAMELGISMGKLFRLINVKLEIEDSPELVALSNRINEIVGRYRTSIKHRQTLRKQAKGRTAKEQKEDEE